MVVYTSDGYIEWRMHRVDASLVDVQSGCMGGG